MSRERSEALIEGLASGLAPVRRVAPLRVSLAGVVAAWLGAVALLVGWRGVQLELLLATSGRALVLLGLVGLGLGAVVAALAASVPGRGATLRAAAGVAASGAGAAGVAALVLGAAGPASPRADLECLALGLVVALLPAAMAGVAAARRYAPRPGRVGLAVAAGAGALGGAAALLACANPIGRHLLVAHTGAALLGAALLWLPLLWLHRRLAERRASDA